MPTDDEKKWIAAWRYAGPELERIRNQELRNLDESAGLDLLGASTRNGAEPNGMAIMQSWFMRLRIKELMKELESR